ncbi:hypothetical protein NKF26_12025 [Haladaptatus sp. AB618]|uniref:hypothetical protein n=1 Tax=Haladaptatus sp. AB618 TaxID=2934173 RepID=UPI00209C1C3A|nr:hypothetical protein [Haladaptatus sp. AB618]MCO8254530.1 hypothetical protein [Haladaptatus sp. AB618]
MDFDTYLENTVEKLTGKETAGLAAYYLLKEEDYDSIETSDITETVKYSGADIPSKNVSAYPSQLARDGYLKKVDSKYRGTHEGKDHFLQMVDLPEVNEQRDGVFLNVNPPDDDFFSPLVHDINRSYRAGVDEGTNILTRKLLENLLVEIMRTHFGVGDSLDLYYNTDERKFKSFSTIIDNFEAEIAKFKPYSTELDDEFVTKLNHFRENANASAHSIDVNLSEEEMQQLSEDGTELVTLLFKIREQVRLASKNWDD